MGPHEKINLILELGMIFTFVVILYTWFNTTAFVEYANLLGLKKFFRIDKMIEQQRVMTHFKDYPTFLLYEYGQPGQNRLQVFFIRLITCPTCIAVWLNIIALCVFNRRIGGVTLLAFNILATWWLYSKIKKSLAQIDE